MTKYLLAALLLWLLLLLLLLPASTCVLDFSHASSNADVPASPLARWFRFDATATVAQHLRGPLFAPADLHAPNSHVTDAHNMIPHCCSWVQHHAH